MIEFSGLPNFRGVAVVGDSVAEAFGTPKAHYGALTVNVTDEPDESDVFDGLGDGGSDVTLAELSSATFSEPGWHVFTVADANGATSVFSVVVFPAAVLEVEQIKYQDRVTRSASLSSSLGAITNSPRERQLGERRQILRSLAQHATQAGAEAALEGGAAVAPYYGAKPSVLCGAPNDSLLPYGATW